MDNHFYVGLAKHISCPPSQTQTVVVEVKLLLVDTILRPTLLDDSLDQVKGILHTSLLQFVLAVVLELFHKLSVLFQDHQLLDFGRSEVSPEWKELKNHHHYF